MFISSNDYEVFLDNYNQLTIITENPNQGFFIVDEYNKKINYKLKKTIKVKNEYHLLFEISEKYRFNKEYYVFNNNGQKIVIKERFVVKSEEFDNEFFYDGQLGSIYNINYTTFHIWAPTSKYIKLVVNHNNEINTYDMLLQNKGVYSYKVEGNIEGASYYYIIKNNGRVIETHDPYALSSQMNSGHSYVIDTNKIHMELSNNTVDNLHINESIIYEVHVRDFSINQNVKFNNPGKFLALTESGLKNDMGFSVGIDYIKELGITHLQLLPIYDFSSVTEYDYDNSYNWGYDPEQYNVIEGRYATNPNDPYNRILEFKNMIKYLKENNIGVIMDVVYNHVFKQHTFSYEKIIPYYFFRYNNKNELSNDSHTGNDVASEKLMVRKYIIDSLKHWAKEYHLNGFRFDLMGLIDTTTMIQACKELREINSNIYIYGEGWVMDTNLNQNKMTTIANANKLEQFGFFNDSFRDTVKGDTFKYKERGLASNNLNYIKQSYSILSGYIEKIFKEPTQSINYVSCHDNHTLFDRMFLYKNDNDIISYIKQSYSLVILSQGVPFLHFGCEFLRSKQGEENSYRSSDEINSIDWNQISDNQNTINHLKALIKLRKKYPILRMSERSDILKNITVKTTKKGLVFYYLNNNSNNSKYENQDLVIIFNFSNSEYEFTIEGNYEYIDIYNDFLTTSFDNNGKIQPFSLIVIKKIQ